MDKSILNKIINNVKTALRDNENLLIKCISEEDEDGTYIDKTRIYEILDYYIDNQDFNVEGKNIGICYSGNYQITIHYILDSIMHKNRIILSNLLCESFTSFIVSIFNVVLKELKIDNPVIKYNCSEQELIQEEKINSIIYIGDEFNFNAFCINYKGKAELKYDSFENIKLILNVDNKENRETYSKIFAFCYEQNINLQRYNTVEELLEDNLDSDYIIAYVDEDNKEKCSKLKYKNIIFNSFPYNDYKFTIVK